jgi:hypothetical protein
MTRPAFHRMFLLFVLFFFTFGLPAQDLPVGKPEELGFSPERLQRLV